MGFDVTRIKEDGLRNGVPLFKDDADGGGSEAGTFDVLTIGIAPEDDPGTGRMITSPPSNVRAESLELSSVSALTGSALTITGYRAHSTSRT
jgi:hypothetical protein